MAAILPRVEAAPGRLTRAAVWMRRHPTVAAGSAILAAIALAGIAAPLVTPVDPLALDPVASLLPPGAGLWEERDYVSFVEAAGQFDPAFYQAMAAMDYLFEEPDTIRRIGCPVLLLTARPMFPGAAHEAGIAAFAGNWRAGERVDVPDSGHAIHFDQFERFVEIAAAFLERSVTQS